MIKYKKLCLSIGILSVAVTPFVAASCSRYSVSRYREIVGILKKYAKNTEYLMNANLPKTIKIKGESKPLKMEYKYLYLAGEISWSTTVDSRKYGDILSGWRTYPSTIVLNPAVPAKGNWPWSSKDAVWSVMNIKSQLNLSLLNNSYIVNHNINITGLKSAATKKIVKGIFTSIFTSMWKNMVIDKWIPIDTSKLSDVQKNSIYDGSIGSNIPILPGYSDWFKGSDVNNVLGYFSFNPGLNIPSIITNYINYPNLNKVKKTDIHSYLIEWIKSDRSQFENMFKNWASGFTFDDLVTSINNINIQN